MQTSSERILTTHTGSLPRPASLTDRFDGAGVRRGGRGDGPPPARGRDRHRERRRGQQAELRDLRDRAADRLRRAAGRQEVERPGGRGLPRVLRAAAGAARRGRRHLTPCSTGRSPTRAAPSVAGRHREPQGGAGFAAGAPGSGDDVFMSAASPGIIALYMPDNQYYAEHRGVHLRARRGDEAGVRRDPRGGPRSCSSTARTWPARWTHLAAPRTDWRSSAGRSRMRLAAVNHATRDIPPDRDAACTCAGATARARTTTTSRSPTSSTWCSPPGRGAVSFEGANPRHEHEWAVFEDVKLPDGKVIIPGVLDSTTNFVEHPELVAQRHGPLRRRGRPGDVIAGTDCGFATFAGQHTVDPRSPGPSWPPWPRAPGSPAPALG